MWGVTGVGLDASDLIVSIRDFRFERENAVNSTPTRPRALVESAGFLLRGIEALILVLLASIPPVEDHSELPSTADG